MAAPHTYQFSTSPPLSYQIKKLDQNLQDSDGDFCVSSYFDDDEEYGEESLTGLPKHVYMKWRKAALMVCGVSIFFEIVLGITSLVLSIILQSPGAFGFAVDSFVDIVTTLMVVWRFCGEEGASFSLEREQKGVLGISVLFVVSSFAVFSKAIFDLVRSNKPYHPYILCGMASVSMVVFTAIAWAKYSISQKLKSKVLFQDAINTLCVDLMACMLLVSLLVYKYTQTWFLGSIVAILISVFLLVYGARNIYKMYSTKGKRLLSDYED